MKEDPSSALFLSASPCCLALTRPPRRLGGASRPTLDDAATLGGGAA